MTEREHHIDTIEALWPIDSQYPDTNETGCGLLMTAILEHDWRDLPNSILATYAGLCRARDKMLANQSLRRYEATP